MPSHNLCEIAERQFGFLCCRQHARNAEVRDGEIVADKVGASFEVIVEHTSKAFEKPSRFLNRRRVGCAHPKRSLDVVLEEQRAGVAREMCCVPIQPTQDVYLFSTILGPQVRAGQPVAIITIVSPAASPDMTTGRSKKSSPSGLGNRAQPVIRDKSAPKVVLNSDADA